MNESWKEHLTANQNKLANDLETIFKIPVFGDEATKTELAEAENYFLIVYGDMQLTNTEGSLAQDVYVVYVSEDNPNVEFTTLDIISVGSKVKGITFGRTIKERVQKGKTEDYFDRVTVIFRRMLKYDTR
ncbi:hypothetical protein KO561_05320 [Radiobacillus kanasensis]|uniref:hypothetical protein n=1 Tax=Radiobacillus kanasensis TaxID=2844358 RepID=UPI001E2C0C4F|nr:hypothetical protein [Radiobacillus kanasensis]UFU00367.1 hypothetical protein KO561_05320 [Radiobacillus kanasensis]